MCNNLENKTALVTGGSRGIGLAITQALQKAGARVFVINDQKDTLEELREQCPGIPEPFTFHADIRNRAALEAIRDQLKSEQISLDILVPNAGINFRMLALELPDDNVRKLIDTNFYGTFVTIQVFAPMLLDRPGGRIIVNSSAVAIHGMSLRALYTGTKAGVSGLVRSLAIEFGPYGTTVNAVGPGIVRTPLVQAYMDDHPDRVEATVAHTPLRRLGEPEDVADVVAFLASDASRFITGQTIYIDGGLTVGSSFW